MQIDLVARLGTFDDFRALYRNGDEAKAYDGRSLAYIALGNNKPPERYAIASFLLDRGSDVTCVSSEGHGALHVLLGQVRHEIPETANLAARVLDGGADINLLDKKSRLPIQSILAMPVTDDELEPLYALWFSRGPLDLLTKNAWGLSPLDLARKVPYRASIVARMEGHLGDRPDDLF